MSLQGLALLVIALRLPLRSIAELVARSHRPTIFATSVGCCATAWKDTRQVESGRDGKNGGSARIWKVVNSPSEPILNLTWKERVEIEP